MADASLLLCVRAFGGRLRVPTAAAPASLAVTVPLAPCTRHAEAFIITAVGTNAGRFDLAEVAKEQLSQRDRGVDPEQDMLLVDDVDEDDNFVVRERGGGSGVAVPDASHSTTYSVESRCGPWC